jgi:membrane associated rhomboid family serine protease
MDTDAEELPEIKADRERLAGAFVLSGLFASLLWVVLILEAVTGIDLSRYGVHPGTLPGLAGILAAPFIHGSEKHLLANTLPIVILGTALLYGYPKAARIVVPALFLLTGLGVWLIGREASHIGASGMTVGAMFFVFTIGALRWDRRAIGLALIVFFMYGGMVWSVFPADPQVSFEAHLSGAVVGTVSALLLRKLDPPPPRKRYSWELEPTPAARAAPWAERVAAAHAQDGVGPVPARVYDGLPYRTGSAPGGGSNMDIAALRRSLDHPAPPEALAPALQALWHLAREEWDAAHAIVQAEDDADSAWVHAHLHRVEGDLSNARYWYQRAHRPESQVSLPAEWEAIVQTLLAR